MTEPITWKKVAWPTKFIKLNDLHDYGLNPRRISKKAFEQLVNDIKKNGFTNRILIDQYGGGTRKPNTIIGGHNRKAALLAAGLSKDDEIEVHIAPRELTEEEFQELNFKDNLPFGEYDMDILANNYNMDKLFDWGAPPEWFPKIEEEPKLPKEEGDDKLCSKCPYREE